MHVIIQLYSPHNMVAQANKTSKNTTNEVEKNDNNRQTNELLLAHACCRRGILLAAFVRVCVFVCMFVCTTTDKLMNMCYGKP